MQLGLYRMIRTQRFIDFTEKKVREKDEKMRETYEAMKPKRRILSKEQADAFYERLTEDAAKRNELKVSPRLSFVGLCLSEPSNACGCVGLS